MKRKEESEKQYFKSINSKPNLVDKLDQSFLDEIKNNKDYGKIIF